MCRIMSISNVSKVKNLEAVMLKVRDLVSEANRDGFGYAVSYKNSVYSEKFLNPDDFVGIGKANIHEKMMSPIFDNNHSLTHGEQGDRPLAIIAHGRTSTNYKGDVDYSHPFVKDDNAFIHNGVVDIPRSHPYDLLTDNDSEYLAHHYWKNGHAGLTKVSGYFAFMNLKLNGKLEIAKDNVASLHAAYIPELDSYVFATLERMITRFCTEMKYTSTKVTPVTSMHFFIVQGSSVKNVTKIDKGLRTKAMSEKEKKAFKDYHPNYKTYIEKSREGTKVIANDNASLPARMNDPHYYMVDDQDMMEFDKKYGVR